VGSCSCRPNPALSPYPLIHKIGISYSTPFVLRLSGCCSSRELRLATCRNALQTVGAPEETPCELLHYRPHGSSTRAAIPRSCHCLLPPRCRDVLLLSEGRPDFNTVVFDSADFPRPQAPRDAGAQAAVQSMRCTEHSLQAHGCGELPREMLLFCQSQPIPTSPGYLFSFSLPRGLSLEAIVQLFT
jgi:hypothetical protein